ncbi:hypothetical protein [Streptomyces sp. KLOTTS4A1]|uniref:hypothetical protein n=1 Tax=Streptomyces sp. KLOTTS4A1 TaxID=3390996 RepID=UPI0039F52270
MGGPLLLYWLTGALVVLWRRGAGTHVCRTSDSPVSVPCMIATQRPLGPVLLTAAATAIIVMSAWALSASAAFALEVLAGRWGMSRIALAWTRLRMARHHARRSELHAAQEEEPPVGLSAEGRKAWLSQNGWRTARKRAAHARYPRQRDRVPVLPTAIGNALVSVSTETRRKYGLDLALCWDPFVKALDAEVRDELIAAATRVFARVQGLMCAAAAGFWAILIPGIWPRLLWVSMCAGLVWAAHRSLRVGIDAYCRHVTDVFAIHRVRLYRALGLKPPAAVQEEVSCGLKLNAVLSRRIPAGSPPIGYEWPPA